MRPHVAQEWIRDKILAPRSMVGRAKAAGYGCYARAARQGTVSVLMKQLVRHPGTQPAIFGEEMV